jgi:BolA protein
MSVEGEIRQRLAASFAASELAVMNESHKHAGHAGDDGTGESHFAVRLRAPELAPLSRVERHRAVHQALGPLTTRIHALSLDLG